MNLKNSGDIKYNLNFEIKLIFLLFKEIKLDQK